MITESDITLYNRYIDSTTRTERWNRTQIKGVHWEESQGINIIKSGLATADKVKVFIPHSSLEALNYVDPMQFKGEGYTIQPGDYLVKGLVEDEITSSTQLEKQYTTAVKIKTVDNRNDAIIPELWHFELGCE